MASSSTEAAVVAMTALANDGSNGAAPIDELKTREKTIGEQRKEIRKLIKKEKRRSRNLSRRLGRIPAQEILEVLAEQQRQKNAGTR